jgi:hypothetical protein
LSNKATITILFNPQRSKDPASKILYFVTSWLGHDIQIEQYSALLSFLIVGMMAVFAIRGMIIQSSKFIDLNTFRSDLPVLILTMLMGFYLQSIVLILRVNLPRNYHSDLMDMFGQMDSRFFMRLFDGWFLLSVIISSVWHYHLTKMKTLQKV